jgi:hypothetical protein
MLAIQDEKFSQIPYPCSIQVKLMNRPASRRGDANQKQMVRTPGKVLIPLVLSRMKEPYPLPCRRVKSKNFVGLRSIASLAGEREVFLVTSPSKRFRINVLN